MAPPARKMPGQWLHQPLTSELGGWSHSCAHGKLAIDRLQWLVTFPEFGREALRDAQILPIPVAFVGAGGHTVDSRFHPLAIVPPFVHKNTKGLGVPLDGDVATNFNQAPISEVWPVATSPFSDVTGFLTPRTGPDTQGRMLFVSEILSRSLICTVWATQREALRVASIHCPAGEDSISGTNLDELHGRLASCLAGPPPRLPRAPSDISTLIV
ncbi:hypothetical protein DFH09DRAFT_1099147 [Mycena vulgaris]|nr:hypothetical protein DFH09DRAFT_1099147 [Mycena vulgaris]